MKRKAVVFTVMMMTAGLSASAAEPVQLSLTPDVAIHDRGVMIRGIALNIWGENPQEALALGIVNGSTGQSLGFSWSLLLNYAESYRGVQWAAVNYATAEFTGWQGGCINYSGGSTYGLQTAFVNYSAHLRGLQLGLFNVAESTDEALQVGVINLLPENETWFGNLPEELAPGMVLVNWSF
ncbi:LA_2272 family surface repeat-containing protein [Kiritimatiella glycovorans]|uniref:Uncharacterized protein n=1 Tax=Kiritimatiella glycovorans TaxID=1307763 RepID=A0A0G3EAY3_9BACT|nr:hypothetical protein [Kiritimatiella glycovorans]AKJ63433.1 hypothetical protein L21SP4_00148 [Kiritimatiella glycovorans]